jgi:hypothetical protein
MWGRDMGAVRVTPLAKIWILAGVLVGCLMATGTSYASTTVPLPPVGPATGHTCSSTQIYVNPVPVSLPPALRGLPIPLGWVPDNLYGNGQTPLGDNCGDVSTGSSAKGAVATASTTFDDADKLAISNTATPSDSPVKEAAHTEGTQGQSGTIVPPLTSQTETLSVTYTYEVLAESHQNADPADIGTGAGLANGAGTLGEAECENANYPQVAVTGDYASDSVGVHTVTDLYTCPAGHPLQTDHVQFGINEGQYLSTFTTTQSSYISARWDGGTLTVGP